MAALLLVLATGCGPTGEALGETARAVPSSREEVLLSFAPVVEKTAPAVVSITSRRTVTVRRPRSLFFDDPFFRHFFGDRGPFGGERRREESALGSGVIVRADGLIVTNHHVVEDAEEISVVLDDRRELPATLIASDERSDLAFLRIDAGDEPLPALPLGDSDDLRTGDLVLAIGNPFGIGQTVTSGIVSARARAAPGARSDVSFIQTDAAINPGNSGGALVSLSGELVGINTAIFTRGGGSIGIGFAIPANLVKARLAGIENGAGLARPWLGVSLQHLDTSLARALGLDRPVGLLVNRVHPAGAGAACGLAKGDVILEVDGHEVFDEPALNQRLALAPMGEPVRLDIWRGGAPGVLSCQREPAPWRPEPDRTRLSGNSPLAGVEVANLSPGLAEELGADMFASGIVVTDVPPGSFAARRLGLRRGDIVESVNGQRVDEVDALRILLDRTRTSRWQIGMRRGNRTFSLRVG